MVKISTLNELSQLAESEFNQPPPRHGLNLLYWLANNHKLLNPRSRDYGFHRFFNRIDDDDDHLLPNQNLLYYEVGNLNALGAEKLPSYIRPHKGPYSKDSNKDRIIVCLDACGSVDRVYVTEHEDQKNFHSSRTYRVSHGLLRQVGEMQRDQFLYKMQQQRKRNHSPRNQGYTNQQSGDSWCTIL